MKFPKFEAIDLHDRCPAQEWHSALVDADTVFSEHYTGGTSPLGLGSLMGIAGDVMSMNGIHRSTGL